MDVLPQPYHMPATPTPRLIGTFGGCVESFGLGERRAPARSQRLETGLEAEPVFHDLPRHGRLARLQRVEDAELEPIEAEPDREFIVKLLLRQRALRHAEAAEGAGRDEMGMHRSSNGAIVRHAIGAGGVHRHAIGDRRSPGRIGAGVEVGGKIHPNQTAIAARANPRSYPRGMALGRRHHRFRTRVDHADGAVQLPGRERDKRLNGKIEFCAETAADSGRQNAHLLGRDAQNFRDVVAIHVGRLRAGLHFYAIADAAREAGLGLDIGVLDKARLELAFHHNVGLGERAFRIAPLHAAASLKCFPHAPHAAEARSFVARPRLSSAPAKVRSSREIS